MKFFLPVYLIFLKSIPKSVHLSPHFVFTEIRNPQISRVQRSFYFLTTQSSIIRPMTDQTTQSSAHLFVHPPPNPLDDSFIHPWYLDSFNKFTTNWNATLLKHQSNHHFSHGSKNPAITYSFHPPLKFTHFQTSRHFLISSPVFRKKLIIRSNNSQLNHSSGVPFTHSGIHSSICLFIHSSTLPSAHPSIDPLYTHPPIHPFIHPPFYPLIHPYTHSSTHSSSPSFRPLTSRPCVRGRSSTLIVSRHVSVDIGLSMNAPPTSRGRWSSSSSSSSSIISSFVSF